MSGESQITRELSIGELLSQTFAAFRQGFMKYFVVFLVVEAAVGVLTTLAINTISIPALTIGSSFAAVTAYLKSYASREATTLVIGWIVGSIATAAAVKLASDGLQGKQVDVQSSVRFTFSKLIWIWILELVVGVLTGLGFLALIIPGIIVYIMFSVALPVLLLEGLGVFDSMRRSRVLVGNRWLKTFGFFLILGIIVAILGLIGGAIGSLFGSASMVAGDMISAFYAPLTAIGVTVYYYSNVARLAPPAPAPTTMMQQTPTIQTGMKFCPSCGAQLTSAAMFCPKCGAKQPV